MQARFLQALQSLDREHGPDSHFYIWAVAERMYQQSPDLQERDSVINGAIAHRRAARQVAAESGDEDAIRAMSLERIIRGYRGQEGRPAVRDKIGHMESAVNLSRTARTLARRGMITRIAKPGYGVVALTDTGRSANLSV